MAMSDAFNDPNTMGQNVAQAQGVSYSDVPKVPEAPKMESGLNYVDPNKSTVAGQLSTLLNTESPYIQQARLAGQQEAAQRGMLNTSMAAGASQRAAIQQALPIASQDATTYAQAQGRQQEGDITGMLDTSQSQQQAALQGQAADQQIRQTQLEGVINKDIAEAGFRSAAELQQAALAGEQEAIKLTNKMNMERDAANAKVEKELTQMGLDASQANTYTSIMGNLTNTALGSVNSLLNNEGITDIPGAIEVINGFLGSTKLGAGVHSPDLDLTGRTAAVSGIFKQAATATPAKTTTPTRTTTGSSIFSNLLARR